MTITSSKTITILIADDHPLAPAGIRSLLAQAEDMEVIGEVQDGFEVKELIPRLHPQLLLLDLKMPGPHPYEIEKWVRENYPDTITLVLTAHDRDAYLTAMMDVGVAGYLSKEGSAERLINAIRRAIRGEIVFDKTQIQRANEWREEVGSKLKQLTPRQYEILELLAKGLCNKTIARSLEISIKTTAYHITQILAKLQVASRQEATIWAIKHLSNDLE